MSDLHDSGPQTPSLPAILDALTRVVAPLQAEMRAGFARLDEKRHERELNCARTHRDVDAEISVLRSAVASVHSEAGRAGDVARDAMARLEAAERKAAARDAVEARIGNQGADALARVQALETAMATRDAVAAERRGAPERWRTWLLIVSVLAGLLGAGWGLVQQINSRGPAPVTAPTGQR